MEVLLAFAVGWAVGARSGQKGYQEVLDALRALRDSDEVRSFAGAMRSHAAAVLHDVGDWLGEREEPLTLTEVLSRLRDRGGG